MKALLAAAALSLAPAAYARPVVVATPCGPSVVVTPVRRRVIVVRPHRLEGRRFLRDRRFDRRAR